MLKNCVLRVSVDTQKWAKARGHQSGKDYGTGGDCRNRSGGSNGTGGLEVCSVSVRIGWRAVHVNVDHRHPRSRKRGIEYERC